MSLAIKYENVDDARMRLRHTVVLYKGETVLISEVKGGDDAGDIVRVMFKELPLTGGRFAPPVPEARGAAARVLAKMKAEEEENLKRKFISSKHFDIAPFKMGYVNRQEGGGAFYCSRMPNRVQKQGLCAENFKGLDNFGRTVEFNTFLSCKEVHAMVHGDYPSFDAALRALEKSPSVAFSREFSLLRDEVIHDLIYLYHKGSKVGMYSMNQVGLGKKYICLKESLQELNVKVGAL